MVAALNQFVARATDKCQPFFQAIKGGKDFKWDENCEKAFQDLKTYLGGSPFLSKPKFGEELFLYLVVSKHAVSVVLIREEERIQWPIYYVSRALLDAQTHYPEMEKLAMALIIDSRKLRAYFQSHPITILTSHPLRQILQRLDMSGRLTKWPVELGEFKVNYRPKTTIKGQALVDFVAEFTYPVIVENQEKKDTTKQDFTKQDENDQEKDTTTLKMYRPKIHIGPTT